MFHNNNIEWKAFLPHSNYIVDVSIYNFELEFLARKLYTWVVTYFDRKAFI